jgi:aminopeptidase N
VIPLSAGPGRAGRPRPAAAAGRRIRARAAIAQRVLVLSRGQQTLTFVDVDTEPVPSLLRGFSAPVVLAWSYTDAELLHLLAHDTTPSTAGKPASAWPCAPPARRWPTGDPAPG